MAKHTKKQSVGIRVLCAILGVVTFVLITTYLMKDSTVALLQPRGEIANEQLKLMLYSVFLLLTVGIPVLVLLYFMAWRYRDTNKKAIYEPEHKVSMPVVFVIWAVPFMMLFLLAIVMWPSTHRLAPKRPIESSEKPITIEVVAMRWKWLFIYPEQNIATVNYIQIPTNTPVQFILAADETPMSSFWIPQLGGQLYAMTGHQNQLNLIASEAGEYTGRSAEINGEGFSGMTFTTKATDKSSFNAWIHDVSHTDKYLDREEYTTLLSPSERHPRILYAEADPDIFSSVLLKYNGMHGQHTNTEGKAE